MKPFRFMAAFPLIAVFLSCVNLKSVREFASESASFSAYTELTTRFRDTYQREQPYLSGQAAQLAQANDRERKAAYHDLLMIHQNVALYLRTLAKLAGDKVFDPSKDLDSMASGIQLNPEFGVDAHQIKAYADLSKVVAKWFAAGYQESSVRELVKEGDPHLQVLLGGMAALVRLYQKTNENEKRSVLGLLEVELPFADTPQDLLLATLARAHLQSKTREYQLADSRYAEAEKGIQKIQEGHRALAEHAGRLTSDETKTLISTFTKDIETIRIDLQTTPIR